MAGITDSPMPNISTSRDKRFARIPVDANQTSFFEGREFRIARKIASPIVFKFSSAVDFILSFQAFAVTSGEYEFYAWRADNVTEDTAFTADVPVLRKNTSAEQLSPQYNTQITVTSGGTITVADANLYADFAWLKTSNATSQKTSVTSQASQGRYLAAGDYYLQFTGTGTGAYYLEWEERP